MRSLAVPPTVLVALGLLAGCGERQAADDELHPARPEEVARVEPAERALAGAHVPTLDPAWMSRAEIVKALGEGPRCEFRYASSGEPVLAMKAAEGKPGDGVVKLNGSLVMLKPEPAGDRIVLAAGEVRLTLAPEAAAGGRQVEADVVFQVGNRLEAGYSGYYSCAG